MKHASYLISNHGVSLVMRPVIVPNLTYQQYDEIAKELFKTVPFAIINDKFITYEKFPDDYVSDGVAITPMSHEGKFADSDKLYTLSMFYFWDSDYIPQQLKRFIVLRPEPAFNLSMGITEILKDLPSITAFQRKGSPKIEMTKSLNLDA